MYSCIFVEIALFIIWFDFGLSQFRRSWGCSRIHYKIFWAKFGQKWL